MGSRWIVCRSDLKYFLQCNARVIQQHKRLRSPKAAHRAISALSAAIDASIFDLDGSCTLGTRHFDASPSMAQQSSRNQRACISLTGNRPPLAGCTKPMKASDGPMSGEKTVLYKSTLFDFIASTNGKPSSEWKNGTDTRYPVPAQSFHDSLMTMNLRGTFTPSFQHVHMMTASQVVEDPSSK